MNDKAWLSDAAAHSSEHSSPESADSAHASFPKILWVIPSNNFSFSTRVTKTND